MTLRSTCFLAAALLYAAGLAGVLSLGKLLVVNVALMLIAFGTACLVVGIVSGSKPRAQMPGR